MLNVYYGNDMVAARRAALLAIEANVEKLGVRVTKLESVNFVPGIIADMLGAVSLFGEVELFLVDTPSENDEFYSEVMNVLAEMGQSRNHFVVVEGTLLAPERKKFEKYTGVIEEYKKTADTPFNVWAMADALSARDKKSLWVLLQDAKRAGLSAEEIIGTLWWQLKTLRMASLTASAHEAGMKDFPYNKAKRSLTHFKAGEIAQLSRGLLKVYHDGHGGIRDIDEGLEEWVLRG